MLLHIESVLETLGNKPHRFGLPSSSDFETNVLKSKKELQEEEDFQMKLTVLSEFYVENSSQLNSNQRKALETI